MGGAIKVLTLTRGMGKQRIPKVFHWILEAVLRQLSRGKCISLCASRGRRALILIAFIIIEKPAFASQ